MKKIVLILFGLTIFLSCDSDKDYEDLNKDPKNPTQVSEDFLFNSATKSLVDQMTSTNVNRNVFRLLGQYWTETTYTDETNYDLTNRNIPENHWSEMYRDVLLDLKTAKLNISNSESLPDREKSAKTAQIEVLEVYTWQQLVDSFGNIPYTEALSDETLPVYDDASTIYSDLISRLNSVLTNLTGTGFSDGLYDGDMAAWSKFGNSLKLKLGIRLSDVNPSLSGTIVTEAINAGVFTSNADNATFTYEAATPNTNPLWVDLVQSGRTDFVPANTIIDIMNTLNDPRRAVYFDNNLGPGIYKGGTYGATSSFANNTHVSDAVQEPTAPASLLDYAEVSFYLAEAAAQSLNGTPADVEGFYNTGISASFEYWGLSNDASAYLANPNVAYTTATGDWREKIGTQFWLAMYNRGFEGWTVWRKYDAPTFNLPAVSGKPVPTRYTYPVNEQNLNETNWQASSAAIGGDLQTTKLFWDKN